MTTHSTSNRRMNTRHPHITQLIPPLLFLVVTLLAGCATVYYATWEQLGKEKRDLLKDNVLAARLEQRETRQEFRDALTQLRSTYEVPSTRLQAVYEELKRHQKRLTRRYNDLEGRIAKLNTIATDLFSEWREEAESISNREFHRRSLEQLAEARARYRHMQTALAQTQNRCRPVLNQFNEYVLFLKHNLNAQALGALHGEAQEIIEGLGNLIEELNNSISETDAFIATL